MSFYYHAHLLCSITVCLSVVLKIISCCNFVLLETKMNAYNFFFFFYWYCPIFLIPYDLVTPWPTCLLIEEITRTYGAHLILSEWRRVYKYHKYMVIKHNVLSVYKKSFSNVVHTAAAVWERIALTPIPQFIPAFMGSV